MGQDTINDQDSSPGNIDTILLGEGILPTDVKLERMGNDLKLTINDTGDSVTVKNWLQADTPGHGVERITFAHTTIWGATEIASALLTGTDGDDLIYGFSIPDTMEGMGGDDTLYGEAGNDTLRGGEGTDTLLGGTGDDLLDGGAGNDTLLGGSQGSYSAFRDNANGNDTYVFGRGSGQDTVVDHDNTPGNTDTIRLADGLTPEDITLHRKGDNLELSINGASDKLIVENWFWNDSPEYKVEQIEFTDGTVWDVHTIQQTILQGTSGDDVLVGYSTSDTLQGYDGNDLLYARGGDDTLHGGTGSDILYGEAGNDTLQGGDGDDRLVGGTGADILDGGTGKAAWFFSPRRKFFIDFSREDPWWRCRDETNRVTGCQVG